MLIDTNILLRLILQDEPALAAQAARIYEKADAADLEVLPMCVAEAVYILRKLTYPRARIAQTLGALLYSEVFLMDKKVLHKALDLYAAQSLDFVDCYLIAESVGQKKSLKTFDKKMTKVYEAEISA